MGALDDRVAKNRAAEGRLEVKMNNDSEIKTTILIILALVLFLSCASRGERLRIAAYKGDSEEASQLIAEGVEIDEKNE